MPARLTPAQAKALGLDVKHKSRVRKTAAAPYASRCVVCGDEFPTEAAESRHVAGGHNRFELILELEGQSGR